MRRMWLGLEIVMASLSPLIKKLNLKSKKNIFCVWLDRTLDTSIQNPPIIIPTLPSYKKNWKTKNNFLINMNPCPVSIVSVQPPVLINTLVHYLSPLFVSNNQESSLFQLQTSQYSLMDLQVQSEFWFSQSWQVQGS